MKKGITLALALTLIVSVISIAGEKKAEIKVDGMTCENCVNKVKTALEKSAGVKSAQVSLENKSAIVLYDDSVTEEASLKKAIQAVGFKTADDKKLCPAGCSKAATCCANKKSE
ncbi:heavy-metal-associated domain-containing protein [candidate division KSB1 bacterium]|nr:heavy-metal-associated domain-containing protein [candidate division KSB1 bacterium]